MITENCGMTEKKLKATSSPITSLHKTVWKIQLVMKESNIFILNFEFVF